MRISFLGLGVMGYPMAGHLVKAGFEVRVYNRTTAKAEQWAKEYAGQAVATVAECVEDADVVLVCVGNDDDVRSVTTSVTGAIANMKAGAILVDHTTTSANLAEELLEATAKANLRFIDAPVSGGQAGAENGVLTVMCGGAPSDFDAMQPVFDAYAKSSVLMGKAGQGQRAKMVNQICIAGALTGLSEGLLLAEKSGLDVHTLVDCLKNGAAGSWQMENRANTMAQDKFDFGFAIDWMIKDLGFCLEEAKQHDLKLPLTEASTEAYKALSAEGLGRMDTSVLLKAIRKQAES
ncbi:2-hydroxy-3-oxopropionate reductase [Vibrio breoganii]|uniref:NAD(P)-dependent oxidoreductase n=1 Tax=Vibrio breoganii TaxID=553239 RepID=UPI000C815D46|nr:NAD(P)-dependent oxidoreductase [Vibrio breoganii]PMG04850.1 2-hydroxy-3-oxopropionate reductase [Vibrio breoganii]PMM04975.1 2-hydroxy-3-oxopropionate reductase [Vibrio breoganii]PMM81268.1 2-hydroxy-3-oxopropionate reductase [Vibrio breoganii]